jgi:glycosyltransferase involved in cell wall biosynthesis
MGSYPRASDTLTSNLGVRGPSSASEGINMSVTVVIPVWDEYVRYLPEAVESAGQDEPDVRVIIVDNASAEALPGAAGARVIEAPQRLSVGAARNLGLHSVDTDFVLFLDADDKLLPGALAFMHERMAANPELAVCSTAILDGATGELHHFPWPLARRLSRWRRLFAAANCVWSLFPIQGCALMRTALAVESGGYPDTDWGDDWVLGASLAFHGEVEMHQRLGRFYRAAPRSISSESRTPQDLLASARRVRSRLREDPGSPRWAKALLPIIAALHITVVYLARPLYLALRGER